MARRRKAAAKPATRRTPRRGKATAAAAGGEASVSAEPAAPEAPAELDPPAEPAPVADAQPSVSQDPQTIQPPKPAPVPTVVLHKKFGKYRCLFNNEDSFSKRYDLGSDSETNSSVEIRVVDPCASSESDSNAAADTQADNASAVTNFSSLNNTTIQQSTYSNMSPVVVLNSLPANSVVPKANEIPVPCEAPLSTELPITSEIPLPSEPPIALSPAEASSCELTVPDEIPLLSEPTLPSGIAIPDGISLPSEIPLPLGAPTTSEAPFPIEASLTSEIPFPEEPSEASIPYPAESVSPGLSMAEVIPLPVGIPLLNDIPMPEGPTLSEVSANHIPDVVTAPALAEMETNRTEVAFDKNYEDSCGVDKENTNPDIPADQEPMDYAGDDEELITIVQIVEDDNHELFYNIKMDSPEETKEQEKKEQDGEFQKHFEKLNISASASAVSMDPRTGPRSQTSEPQLPKNESLVRPDPSLTPSSIQSDDSNSSRVTEPAINFSNESAESSPSGVRRSSRIKTISSQKQKSKGYGLVKTPLKKALITQTKLKLEENSDSQEKSGDATNNAPNSPSFPVPSDLPVKVKSRWRRSSELEMGAHSPANSPLASPGLPQRLQPVPEAQNLEEDQAAPALSKEAYDKIIDERMKQFQHLDENEYLCERMISKDTKKMICDCFMTKEEIERGELGCGEDCLNRLLMIECNSRCPVGDRCTNRRFERRENGALRVFYADKKGCGVEAADDITAGEFLMEYVGEVLDYDQFYKRAQTYSDENNLHHYFMSLKGDTVIDATMKGNISRFINHSCDPNAETQKWTVNGELRIGFFSKRDIAVGEEITFDYQFKRFGKEAQRCYCGADSCRGWIGGEPDSDDEGEEEEEEEDVSTSKSETEESVEDPARAQAPETPRPRPRRPRRPRQYKPSAELVQDADIEEDLEALHRTGVKNQSHTLRLSRTVVRAKTRRAQVALLRLLRDADLPCRRLFLDYRGLRLLAPWCTDAPVHFRLEMLQTVDRLPITNKTMVSESRFFTIVERWLGDAPPDVFIDETTGLPIELPNRTQDETSPEKSKENAAILEKVKDLSSQLLERWSSLKEAFKIPKKERIQQMKEHERQANVERRAADSSGSRDRDRDRRDERERERERDRERERERDRERDRERERDRDRYRERERERDRERDERDRRKRRGSSPDGRRSIRSSRVLATVPPLSKEERRRAFAEAAAAAEDSRRQRDHFAHYWPEHNAFPQMFPPGMLGAPPNMLPPMVGGGLPPGMAGMAPGMAGMAGMVPGMGEVPPEWMGPGGEFQPPQGFCPPFGPPQQFCVPQANLMGMSGYGMPGFMFGQQMPPNAFPPTPQPADNVMPVSAPAAAAEAVPAGEVVLPSMWRSAVDARGRTYYYHVKLRQPQWLPPPPPAEDESSSEEETEQVSAVDALTERRKGKVVEGVNGIYEVIRESNGLIPDHALVSVKPRKRRPGLVSERPISPRTEEDKLAGRQEVKRYRQTKEKLRRRREKLLHKVRELAQRSRKHKALDQAIKMVDLVDSDSDSEQSAEETEPTPAAAAASAPAAAAAEPEVPAPAPSPVDTEAAVRRLKEQFRSTMARVMVHHLNPYRHSDAPAGRITCTADFKHLARKLTHFVMLKELKHCRSVEELVVTDSVRSKAKEFVKKYMAKFGKVYRRPAEEAD